MRSAQMLIVVVTLVIIACIAGILGFGGNCRSRGGHREDRILRRFGAVRDLAADDRLPRRLRASPIAEWTFVSGLRFQLRGSPPTILILPGRLLPRAVLAWSVRARRLQR